MDNNIFRKESLERIESPDDIRKYLHISSPRLWMVLSAILVVLVGFVIYSSVVTIENTISVQAEVTTFSDINDIDEPVSVITVELPAEMKDMIEVGMLFRIAGQEGKVVSLLAMDDVVVAAARLYDSSVLLQSGTYDAEIVLENISPLSFLMN